MFSFVSISFNFITEALLSMLRYAEANNLIHGIQFGRAGLSISHLFFTDDSLIFARAATAECAHLKSLLNKYYAASGQVINFGKPSILISSNASSATANLIQIILI